MKVLRHYFIFSKKIWTIFFAMLFLPLMGKSAAKNVFDFNENCKKAYELMVSLQLNKAAELISTEKKQNPKNAVVAYLEHAHDFMIFFVEEKGKDFKTMDAHLNERLNVLEKADDKSPWQKYLIAQMNLEACILNGKMGNYFTALIEVRRANILLNENLKKFPAFIPSKKGLGLIHCLMGTVPEKYKWGANLLGFNGNLQQGMNELWQVKDYADKNDFYCKHELNFLYVYGLLFMQNDKKNSWLIAKKLWDENSQNKLYCFLAANVALSTAQNDAAIAVLKNKPTSPDYLNFDYLNYMMGVALLRKLDATSVDYLEKFLKADDRQNFVKDGYQKLAWAYLLKNDLVNYAKALQKCKTKGNTVVDADKQALREVEAGEQPDLLLLKARLLCDGGYYKEAIDLMAGHKMQEFKTKKDQVEFVYRAGRIYHDWGFADKAIPYYNAAIEYGGDLPQYYACNAALNLGLIYEQKKDKQQAEKFFKLCINSKNADYKNSLEQKAKTGLERLKKMK